MTEYETASLTLQGYALIAQVLTGAIQCVLIVGGLWLMKKASNTRDDQHQEAQDRHQETMEVLQQQREGLQQQREAMQQQGETLRALGESMQQQGEALHALIERTARPA